MMRIAVIKAGGSVLNSPSDYVRLAEAIRELYVKGYAIALVVSAMKGVTDELIKMTQLIAGKCIDLELIDEILSMGERTSARFMALALRAQGLNVRLFDPVQPDWPIITDEVHTRANPLMEDTREAIERYLKPLLAKGVIAVIPGFIGISRYGRITTLGRNTSDLTAAILARYLGAELLIFLKDVGGIAQTMMSGRSYILDVIDLYDLRELVRHGARVLHPNAIDHISPFTKVLFTSVEALPDLKGTEVIFPQHNSIEVIVGLTFITFVGVADPFGLLSRILPYILRNSKLVDILVKRRAMSFIFKDFSEELQGGLEEALRLKLAEALHIERNVALVRVTPPHVREFFENINYVKNELSAYEAILMENEAKLIIPADKVKSLEASLSKAVKVKVHG